MSNREAVTGQRAVNATAPLIANIVGVLGCFPLAIAGIVLAHSAANKAQHDPDAARRAVRWSWACFGVCAAMIVFFFATQPNLTLQLLGLS